MFQEESLGRVSKTVGLEAGGPDRKPCRIPEEERKTEPEQRIWKIVGESKGQGAAAFDPGD